jgi:hypothetical protein
MPIESRMEWHGGMGHRRLESPCEKLHGNTQLRSAPERTVTDIADRLDCEIAINGREGVEVEIAFRMARDFPAQAPFQNESVLDAIASAHIAVGLCASRFTELGLAAGGSAGPDHERGSEAA